MYVCMYVCMSARMCVHIYIYTHTHGRGCLLMMCPVFFAWFLLTRSSGRVQNSFCQTSFELVCLKGAQRLSCKNLVCARRLGLHVLRSDVRDNIEERETIRRDHEATGQTMYKGFSCICLLHVDILMHMYVCVYIIYIYIYIYLSLSLPLSWRKPGRDYFGVCGVSLPEPIPAPRMPMHRGSFWQASIRRVPCMSRHIYIYTHTHGNSEYAAELWSLQIPEPGRKSESGSLRDGFESVGHTPLREEVGFTFLGFWM